MRLPRRALFRIRCWLIFCPMFSHRDNPHP
jgi:hypothetical protein